MVLSEDAFLVFSVVVLSILALGMITLPIFGRLSMRRIEKSIMAEGLPRPCYWDGAGFRIVLYAGALTIPTIMFNKHDEEPGKVNPKLVNKYARSYDRVLAWIFMFSIFGVLVSTLLMMALGITD